MSNEEFLSLIISIRDACREFDDEALDAINGDDPTMVEDGLAQLTAAVNALNNAMSE